MFSPHELGYSHTDEEFMETLSEKIKQLQLKQQRLQKYETGVRGVTYYDPREVPEQPDNSEEALIDRNITMSNALARSAHGLNLAQKRIIALALAKTNNLDNREAFEGDRIGWKITLAAKEYAEAYETDTSNGYDQLKEGARGLLRALWRTVEVHKKGSTVTQGQWLSLARYHEGKGFIEVVFHPMVAPHVLALKDQFVTYKLKQTNALRSIYSWRLYECLKSWESTGRWTVSIKDFINIMEIPPSYQKDFGQISRWILNPAIKELQEKNDLLIDLKKYKKGRQIDELEFIFKMNPQPSLDLEGNRS